MNQLPYRRPKQITLKSFVGRAFAVKRFEVLCPVCSAFNRLSKSPRLITQYNDWLQRCRECGQQMLYNPWRDIPKGENPPEVDDSKPEPITSISTETFMEMLPLIHESGAEL